MTIQRLRLMIVYLGKRVNDQSILQGQVPRVWNHYHDINHSFLSLFPPSTLSASRFLLFY